jgi:CheY-like chemotaxis protein
MDPSQVSQVLTNLAVNARDAIGGVGTLHISCANARFDDAPSLGRGDAGPGDYVVLTVRDSGSGMPPEVIEHLFEPFFTTKAPGEGTGLGLATVHGIVHQNGGFIDVASEPGRGTTFRIGLPRYVGRAAEGEAAEGATPRGQETVLLVEDEPAILNVVRRMLENLGYRVLAAVTPGQAIRMAEEHAGAIDLLVSDVVMPEMNGRDLAKRLLVLHPGIRRLFVSGYAAEIIAYRGVLDEGTHFLQKPFSSAALSAKVREALG